MDNNKMMEYENFQDNINSVQNYAKKLGNIFDDFGTSVNRVLQDDAFRGTACESFRAKYDEMKPKLNDYIALIEQFAKEMIACKNAYESTESSVRKDAENLAS